MNGRTRRALGWLGEHQPSTLRDFQDAAGWSSSATAHSAVRSLELAGIVVSEPGRARTLRLAPGVVVSRSGHLVGRVRALRGPLCKVSECGAEAVTAVTIRLPKQWDDATLVAEEVRDQLLDVCGWHAGVLAAHGVR